MRDQFNDAERQNERLVGVLQEAKQQIELLKEEVDKLCAPPNNYGIFHRPNKDGTAEIVVDGRQMRVNVHPNLDPFQFEEGQMVVLNEAFNVVEPSGYTARGEIAIDRRPARRQPRHRAWATPTTSGSSHSPSRCGARS